MQILIMRHGDAISKAVSDTEKSLTDRGCYESNLIAQWLSDQMVDIDRVLISPYLRTKQTLNILQEYLMLNDHEILSELMPSGDIRLISCYLYTLANKGLDRVLIISHMPLVSYLVTSLCPKEQPPIFATSAIAAVDLDAVSGSSKLCWHISPNQLRRKFE